MGSYVGASLTKDESVLSEARLHWIRFASLRSALTLFIAPLLAGWSTEYVCTNKRIIWKRGLIRRATGEMNLKKVENVQVHQGFVGRILGYGRVDIVGTGGTTEPFAGIASPVSFRRTVQAAMESAGG